MSGWLALGGLVLIGASNIVDWSDKGSRFDLVVGLVFLIFAVLMFVSLVSKS